MNISILGDSISAYTGYTTSDFKTFYGEGQHPECGIESVDDTWLSLFYQEM